MAKEVGKWIPLGLAEGIEDNIKPVTAAMKELANLTTGTIESEIKVRSVGFGRVEQGSSSRDSIIQNIVINSPTPLSPSETARQIKNASRQLAMGW